MCVCVCVCVWGREPKNALKNQNLLIKKKKKKKQAAGKGRRKVGVPFRLQLAVPIKYIKPTTVSQQECPAVGAGGHATHSLIKSCIHSGQSCLPWAASGLQEGCSTTADLPTLGRQGTGGLGSPSAHPVKH